MQRARIYITHGQHQSDSSANQENDPKFKYGFTDESQHGETIKREKEEAQATAGRPEEKLCEILNQPEHAECPFVCFPSGRILTFAFKRDFESGKITNLRWQPIPNP